MTDRISKVGFTGSILTAVITSLLAFGARAEEAPSPDPEADPTAIPRVDTTPPPITVSMADPSAAPGLIFIAPKTARSDLVQGPLIIDDSGRPVWFHPLQGQQTMGFRVQRYQGQPVLTWAQTETVSGEPGANFGTTTDYIYDQSYELVATVHAGNGFATDPRDFVITDDDTALITIYNSVPYDLSPFGGPAEGTALEAVVQEVDIASGAVVFEWHSLDHVAIDESYAPSVSVAAGTSHDYFHINSIAVDNDGQLLISGRQTWTVYKVDRHSGEVLWRLGGKRSDFAIGAEASMSWQHDAEPADGSTLRILDNHSTGARNRPSRVLWLSPDLSTQSVSLVRVIQHPTGIVSPSQGNAQALPNGNTFVGWGQAGVFSEFDAAGGLVFDARVPLEYDTYRAYRMPWHGRPKARPTARAQRDVEGKLTVHAFWNGATEVADWFVIGGRGHCGSWPLGHAVWNGLDTPIELDSDALHVAVVARDAKGRWLGRSRLVPVEAAP
jgi:Arylsulfotransferase (ASST)